MQRERKRGYKIISCKPLFYLVAKDGIEPPKGKPSNFTKNKPWKDAIRRAVLARDGNALRSLSEALIDKALTGDVSALREAGAGQP